MAVLLMTAPSGARLPRGNVTVDINPRAFEAGVIGDGGDVQQQVHRAAEGSVNGHGIANGGIGQDVARVDAAFLHVDERPAGAARQVEPEWLSRRGEGSVRESQSERLA